MIQLAIQLEHARDTARELLGDTWPATVARLKPEIERIMAEERNPNPLSAVIPAAKAMVSAGKNPLTLIAVAVEMSSPSDAALAARLSS